jgi:acetoin:2,6-dichlorophenolindophenol oxidoreductase subunit beta
MPEITYIQAIREALDQSMVQDNQVIVIGEGVPDPKNIFNSTKGLQEKFGNQRVFDMPLSENGMTGVCIGAAIRGFRPILIHQRVDFALLSLDQIINNAAKWHYMFNGKASVPMVIRMIVGRGWGQGPQHSQSYQAMFAQIPGLKVVMPATAYDAKGMLIAAIKDKNPVIFLEHRWVHHIMDDVPEDFYEVELGKARIIKKGSDITIAAFSYMVFEALIAAKALEKFLSISVEIIDMRSARPLDIGTVVSSIKKTKHLIVADTAYAFGSIASELIASVVNECFDSLKKAPLKICSPDFPTPSSPGMTKDYYPSPRTILEAVIKMKDVNIEGSKLETLIASVERKDLHDIPNRDFKGPF